MKRRVFESSNRCWPRLLWLTALLIVPLTACTAEDEADPGWTLQEPKVEGDAGLDTREPDIPRLDPDGESVPDAVDTVDVPDISDTEDVPDVEDIVDEPTEEEVEEVPRGNALTDRTSLVIDSDGTWWLGYHRCRDDGCSRADLVVARRGRSENAWTIEEIQRGHEGIFGLAVIEPGRPIAVYPNANDGTFKVAMRQTSGQWSHTNLDIGGRTVRGNDGFDVTHDDRRFFVTFAPDGGSRVLLFSYDTQQSNPSWKRRMSLNASDPRAAMGPGFRADTDDSAYLVHYSRNRDRYGLARYDKADDVWPQRVYFDDPNQDAYVHSFIITDDFQLCTSSNLNQRLLITCGSMFDLDQTRTYFENEVLARRHPSSIVEGPNGTLYVAYNPQGNDKLELVSRPPDENSWTKQTLYDGSSYGISTDIDIDGDLAMSFYTCDSEGQCSLKILER